jgi:putative membrane protein
MNKDLVLREFLAIERTKMANETTLLAYIRTGLYFLVAGSTLGHIVGTTFWKVAGGPLIAIGVGVVMAGIIRFKKVNKAIEISKQNIGNSSETFLKSIRGSL